jgi:uncharacterized membrane protein YgcG
MSTLEIIGLITLGIALFIAACYVGIIGLLFDIVCAIAGGLSDDSGSSDGGGFGGGDSGGGGSSDDF